ncbi:MAG: hypothetical protein HYX82_04165 [Chloroflexi bacterium]|nr:hypothetical protein [Chloroflexota bacterium]
MGIPKKGLKALALVAATAMSLAACNPPIVPVPTPAATSKASPEPTSSPTRPISPAPTRTPTATIPSPSPTPSPTPTPTPVLPTQYGGTLVWPFDGPRGFDPHSNTDYRTQTMLGFVNIKLTTYDYRSSQYSRGTNILRGDLAESWKVSPDGRTYTFYLRKGVRFANIEPMNGREVTAEDVKWSWERTMRPGNMLDDTYVYESIEKIEVLNRYTVRFWLTASDARFPFEAASRQAYILAKEVEEKFRGFNTVGSVMGAGPWFLEEYVPDNWYVMKRNPDYYEKDAPFLESVKVVIMPQVSTRVAALTVNRADIVGWFPYMSVEDGLALRKDGRVNVKAKSAPESWWWLSMKATEKPFDDVRVRRAVAMALNRKEWSDTVYQGYADWPLGPIPPAFGAVALGQEAYPQNVQPYFEYRPDRARELLEDAGYPAGLNTTINTTSAYGEEQMKEAKLIARWLGEVGIKAEVKDWPYSEWLSGPYRGDYEGIFWGPDVADTLESQLIPRYSCNSPRNHSTVCDPSLEKLLQEWRGTQDESKSRSILRDIQVYLAEKQYAIPSPLPQRFTAWQPWVKNYNGEDANAYDQGRRFAYIWIEK